MKVEAAVGELAKEYEGHVDFNVIPAEETNRRTAEIESYGFAEQRHGLVGFDANGEVRVKIPGHDYGKSEIILAIQRVLAEE